MDNNFDTTVSSLFKGMDSFISTKTVVGDAVTIGDTIILPLVDVSFGVGAGAFSGDKKQNAGGGMGSKDFAQRNPCDFRRRYKACERKKSGYGNEDSRYGS